MNTRLFYLLPFWLVSGAVLAAPSAPVDKPGLSTSCLSNPASKAGLNLRNHGEKPFTKVFAIKLKGSAENDPLLRRVQIRVAPYGNIFVDEELIAENSTFLSTRLFPGEHVLRIENPYGKTVTKKVRIPKRGELPELYFHLKPKPAQLVVQSNVDADIRLDGSSVGRSWSSETTPIVIPMDNDWRGHATYRIELHRDGFLPSEVEGTLRAGTKTVLRVDLKSQPNPQSSSRGNQRHRYKTTIEELGL